MQSCRGERGWCLKRALPPDTLRICEEGLEERPEELPHAGKPHQQPTDLRALMRGRGATVGKVQQPKAHVCGLGVVQTNEVTVRQC